MIVISTRTYSAVSRLVSCHSSEQDVMCVIMAMRWRVGLAMACDGVPHAYRRSPRCRWRWTCYGCCVYCARAIKLATRGEAAVKQMSTKGFVQLQYVYPPAAQSGGSTSPGWSAFSTSLFIVTMQQDTAPPCATGSGLPCEIGQVIFCICGFPNKNKLKQLTKYLCCVP